MYYIEVLVGVSSFHGNGALTYSCDTPLHRGSVVVVPLRNTQVLGVVSKNVDRPTFPTKHIIDQPAVPRLPEETLQLISWMQQYYPAPLGVTVGLFLPKQLPKKENPITNFAPAPYSPLPALTNDQSAAVQAIAHSGMHLLHGETGTGKTRVYIELAKQAIDNNKSVVVLTPEIGLTSQLAYDFQKVFGARVVVIHSQLTEATRQRLWLSLLKQADPVIILGPRSALFSPLRSLGLIVIDESHETAYKQDQAPYYHAARVASKLASLHDCPVVMGSATPLVSDYYMAQAKERPIIRMTQTASGADSSQAEVHIIDLKDRAQFTKKSHLSDALIAAIKDSLHKQEQILLFLNRRGTARVVFCEQCGWQALCPHCDVPLVYHGDTHQMRCHTCEYHRSVPTGCPECHNASVVFKSVGTKAIVDEVTKLFPEARIQRFDTDNKKDERIEQHHQALKNGDVDIIIGTQTLAKGLDLPKLGLVGIIVADTSLYFPDFSAQERTYQLIGQVLGRVGRGHRSSKAIIQTYSPDSPLLKAILDKDWQVFYNQELSERKMFLFPPFCYLLKLTCRRASTESAIKAADTFAQAIKRMGLRVLVEGPAPAFHEKVLNKYQWQLIVKAKDRNELLKIIHALPSGWSYDIDPINLL